ncbi:MAG: alginate lyase family protein [Chloroflexi bacterium]|nr:alginate lyase family protein [Chloroflexota bacterium]MBI3339073.1 alginate lyase family protein [Chloroflexota bacterium]
MFLFSVLVKSLFQLGLEPLALNALYKFGLWTGHYRRAIPEPRYSNIELSNIVHLFSLPSRRELLETMSKDGQAALLKEADEIVGGKFRMFGGEPVALQLTFNQPLHHWADYETRKVPIPYSQFPIPDIKFVWEPARFGWAFTLGRAYYVTQNEKYAEAFWKYFESFGESNPPYLGPHWMNGQEVALRMMSLVWAAQVFETASVTNPERRGQLIQSIYAHANRIPPTLIYACSQNNNHLITESAAMYIAGLFFNESKWRALGWRWLNRALQNQISDYGEYIQHSANYHRVMLQTALFVHAIKKDDWPRATSQALTRAAHWLFSMLDPASGRTPNLGANDGALILPLSSTPFDDFRPTVQAAARAFLQTGLPAGVWDELSLWLGLPVSERTSDSDAYLSDHLRAANSWAYLRASRFKSRLSQMDQLHLDLWWRGLNIAQDAGTYLYNAGAPWDNPLVSTRVHNTLTVDGRDQMTRGGRFMTLDWSPAHSKNVLDADERILGRVLAYHKGYQRLGIRHEREVTAFVDERWQIKDKLLFTQPAAHVFRLHWLLIDGEWGIENGEQGVGIRVKSKYGWIALNIESGIRISKSEYRVSLIRAGELIYGTGQPLPFEGWVSPTYSVKVPALSLAVEVTSSKMITFTSEFIFPTIDNGR